MLIKWLNLIKRKIFKKIILLMFNLYIFYYLKVYLNLDKFHFLHV